MGRTGSQNSEFNPYESLLMRDVILSKCTGSWRPSRLTTNMLKGSLNTNGVRGARGSGSSAGPESVCQRDSFGI